MNLTTPYTGDIQMTAILLTTPETTEARIVDRVGNELITRYFDNENQAIDFAEQLGAEVSYDSM